MNLNVILAKRENEVTECIAWGGSYKETASLLQISVRTVDNTLRKVKEKLGLNKINEISAWWFCTHHNISLDLSPFVRRQISVILLCIFISGEISISTDSPYTTRRSRRSRTEYRARRQELLSINHTLFNQDTHKECVREKPGVLVIHYYFNEKIEVYHFNYQPFKSRAQGGM